MNKENKFGQEHRDALDKLIESLMLSSSRNQIAQIALDSSASIFAVMEQLGELENDVEMWKDMANNKTQSINRLQKICEEHEDRIRELENVLEFYTNGWIENADGDLSEPHLTRRWIEASEELLEDLGCRAQDVLKKSEIEKKKSA